MNNNAQPFTLGIWTAKAGCETAFITEWTKFAQWTASTQPGAKTGILLQDPSHPRQFISVGPWESMEAIRSWRESSEFKAFAKKVQELCDEFQPRSLVLAASTD